MHKNTVNVRELVNKYQTNCERISAIADTCEKEPVSYTHLTLPTKISV